MRSRLALILFCLFAVAPAAHAQTWRLVEEWRVGGEVEGAYSFQDVRGLERLPNGGLVVLEFKDQQLHFLDARGKLVRTVGRMGAGPGEYQNANGLIVLPNGNIVINDPDNNRLTILGPAGDFLKTVPMSTARSFGWKWDAWADRQGKVVEPIYVRRGASGIRGRQIWFSDFARSDTLYDATCPPAPLPPQEDLAFSFRGARGGMSMMIPFVAPRELSIRDPDGGRWSSTWPEFAVITRTPAGTCIPDVTIRLPGPRVELSKRVRDSVVAAVTTAAREYTSTLPDLDKIPRAFPRYDAIRLDPSGKLWVVRQRTASDRQFEVYRQDGRQVATLDLPATFEPVRPMILGADRLYGFVTDDDDLPYLVAYRIVR